MRIAHRILISAVWLLRRLWRLRLLIRRRRRCVRSWGNKHRGVRCVQRRVFDPTRGRLGIDVLARVLVWVWGRCPGRRRISHLTRGALHLLRLAAARAVAPGFLRVAFDFRIERVCVVFALLCFQRAPPAKQAPSILLVHDLILNRMPAMLSLRDVERLDHWTTAGQSNY